jgi:hypothetical protein
MNNIKQKTYNKLDAFHLESHTLLMDSKLTWIVFIPSGITARTTTETERNGQ